MDYSEVCKAYRIWNPLKKQIEVARDIRVLNYPYYESKRDNDEKPTEIEIIHGIHNKDASSDYESEEEENFVSIEDGSEEEEDIDKNCIQHNENEDSTQEEKINTTSHRQRKTPVWTKDYHMGLIMCEEMN